MTDYIELYTDEELPDRQIRWLQGDGTPYNFTAGYTFRAEFLNVTTGAVVFTKSSGIVGSAGTGNTANVALAFTLNELSTRAGQYRLRLQYTETATGRRGVFKESGQLPRVSILTAPV